MELKAEFHGLANLQRRLAAVQSLPNSNEVNRALGRGAERMEAAVKMLTPVDTGNLRNKIVAVPERFLEWIVATNVEYATFVEFGTGRLGDPAVPHTSRSSWTYYSDVLGRFVTTHGQAPAAMFRQGFESTHDEVFLIVTREIEEIIRNA